MKYLVFTADDFGLAPEVNAAIVRAHRDGVLTAASLMIGAPAAAEAVALARMLPDLGVGLHVVVADGLPLLPPEQIPTLVDRNGRLPSHLAASGIHWALSSAARAQLRREIEAQFAAFHATGLAFDHVNAHNHMHLHPTVLDTIIGCARNYGIRHVRLPYEPLAFSGGGWGRRLIVAGLSPWIAAMRWRLRRNGLSCNDALVGLSATGHMTESRVLAALTRVKDGVTEFYFHPAEYTTAELELAAPGYDRTGELDALTSPAVIRYLMEQGLKPCVFRSLP